MMEAVHSEFVPQAVLSLLLSEEDAIDLSEAWLQRALLSEMPERSLDKEMQGG